MTAPAALAADPDADIRAEIASLQARIAEVKAQVAAQRELNHALRTAADFADTDRSGYIDRTGLENAP